MNFSFRVRNTIYIASGVILCIIACLAFYISMDKKRINREAENEKINVEYSLLKDENNELNQRNKLLIEDYNALNKKYTKLTDSILSQQEQLNLALKIKTDDLEKKVTKLKTIQKYFFKQDSLLKNLNQQVKSVFSNLTSSEYKIQIKKDKLIISLFEKLLFKSGNITLEAKSEDIMKKIASIIAKNNDVVILIEGHTDNSPLKSKLFKDNLEFSAARAYAFQKTLCSQYKIPGIKITSSGKGDLFPIATNTTNDGKAQNRRIDISFVLKQDELFKLMDEYLKKQ